MPTKPIPTSAPTGRWAPLSGCVSITAFTAATADTQQTICLRETRDQKMIIRGPRCMLGTLTTGESPGRGSSSGGNRDRYTDHAKRGRDGAGRLADVLFQNLSPCISASLGLQCTCTCNLSGRLGRSAGALLGRVGIPVRALSVFRHFARRRLPARGLVDDRHVGSDTTESRAASGGTRPGR